MQVNARKIIQGWIGEKGRGKNEVINKKKEKKVINKENYVKKRKKDRT